MAPESAQAAEPAQARGLAADDLHARVSPVGDVLRSLVIALVGANVRVHGPLPPVNQAVELTPESLDSPLDGRVVAESRTRRSYLHGLALAFAVFSSIRMFTYLPTLWAIHTSADSSQHSLWTWATWVGANATMPAWLYENNNQRFNSASMVSAGNALMCQLTSLTISYYRR